MVTHCENCIHCDKVGKEIHPRAWLCMKHKRLEGFGFVSTTGRGLPPYLNCYQVNGGACPLYSENDIKQRDLKLEEKTK